MPSFYNDSHNDQLRKVKKDQTTVFLLGIAAFLTFSLLFTVTHYWVTHSSIDELNTQQNKLSHQTTLKGIAFYLKELHKRLDLFVNTHKTLIDELAENPNDEVTYDALLNETLRYFPDMGSFSITDERGNPLFEDLEGIIQGVCIEDTKKYLKTHHPETRLHPNPIFPHIDIVSTYIEPGGLQRTFLINFPAHLITDILKQFTPPNSEQLLVARQKPTRIEFKTTGFRHQQSGQWDLNPDDLHHFPHAFQSPVPNTQWILITYTAPQKILADQQKLWQIVLQDSAIQLILGILLFLMLRKVLNHAVQNVHLIHYTASHDPLTGLYNRAHFISLLLQTLHFAHREQMHVALLFIDLDGFKPVNDQYGHEIGDFVLKEIAKRLIDHRRESDIVARLGGDEFVIALPDVKNEASTYQLIQQIRQAIQQPITLPNGQMVKLNASIGLACYKADSAVTQETVDQLLNEADHKMYDEKKIHHAKA